MADDIILLAHGGGGLRSRQLIEETLFPILENRILAQADDAACLTLKEHEIALTTDSYVVDPLFFPGGDIGKLAACGTINDLAMQAAEPRFLTLGLILEEGFPLRDLERAIRSLAEVVREVGAFVVTGDIKVVERGKGGGMFINTSGLGVRRYVADGRVSGARPGDAVIISGTIGDHGMAVMSRREGLQFESEIVSDVAPLWGMIHALLEASVPLHGLRDPTRGGLTAALCDIARASRVGIRIRETAVPIRRDVCAACSLLGLDPMNVANEGKAVVVCPGEEARRAVDVLRSHPLGCGASWIGDVTVEPVGMVLLETEIGGERILSLPAGEELPRIC